MLTLTIYQVDFVAQQRWSERDQRVRLCHVEKICAALCIDEFRFAVMTTM